MDPGGGCQLVDVADEYPGPTPGTPVAGTMAPEGTLCVGIPCDTAPFPNVPFIGAP